MAQLRNGSGENKHKDEFHVIHKIPTGDSPYVRAKHVQLVEKDPEAAIVLFWKAINAGDKVDSALKDMAVVMKQQDRAEEAIEAIKSFRDRCSKQGQESLDNVLIDLYKKCGMIDEQIELLKQKLRMIYQGEVFNGKPTKTARSHGKKFQVSIKQETSRILGNLGWAYMQQPNYIAAEVVYKKAQMIDPDWNKACNLSLCLIKLGRLDEARSILQDVLDGRIINATASSLSSSSLSEDTKPKNRAEEMLHQLDQLNQYYKSEEQFSLFSSTTSPSAAPKPSFEETVVETLDKLMVNNNYEWVPSFRSSRRLPIFEEISQLRDQLACN
ncbi:hypothetical protein C5167_030599 [Papaver somniferum]|uniref:protein SULFUR DEFICIENCY-INDUCED 1-like n=1 Tax=Papaver somniferum TaxID=3469 RepID=UPI000E6F7AC3|nr:protein SULFUR DEFICIENCY-INDUCED 1-like [Papaver somniferum]RZC88907.1 hypothetical protein C5167_030599 [Papaver somniferum]